MENNSKCPTPHIAAMPEDFGKTVLMPGDPLRSQYIANTYLEQARLINNVRGVQGYTGLYHGVKVTVMASGMGMPSIGIYSYELYHFFNVANIIRIGSAGAIADGIRLRDLLIGMGASTDSDFAKQYHLDATFAPIADYHLLRTAADICEERKSVYHVGNLMSSDVFYNDHFEVNETWKKMGIMAVEMEAAALYMNAARAGKRALCICTTSDHILKDEHLSAQERQVGFGEMVEVALETAVRMENLK